jgi:hypothetical protein
MHRTETKVDLAYAQAHASEITEILRAHHFDNPQFVDYDDPHFGLTLMATPDESVSLLNVAAAMEDFEGRLGIKVFLLTPSEFERSGQQVPFFPITRTA